MSQRTTVETTSGSVCGRANGMVVSFKGIPYARDPVDQLRFAPPALPVPWSETLDASDFGPVAPQSVSPLEVLLGGGNAPQSEARCLTLNVWTPGTDDARRAVMVWVHGGAFLTGSGSAPWYDGASLAGAGDVVVVTFNYRLGALGYMYLGGLAGSPEVPCNFGLLDQLAVLSWVRENAAVFGGDPDRITVFGQSAGAMSIGAMLGVPGLGHLVRRAVLQSGACSHTVSAQMAAENTAVVLGRLGLSPDRVDLLDSLRELPTAAFLNAQAALLPASVDGMALLPVVDGITLAVKPLEAVVEGSAAGMDLLIGTNADEARTFTIGDPSLNVMGEKDLEARSAQIWTDPADMRRAIDVYRRSRPDEAPRDIWTAISTDKIFRIPAIRLAEAQAVGRLRGPMSTPPGAPAPPAFPARPGASVPSEPATFAYLFKWRAPAFGGVYGACHSLEIPFVFDNLHQPGMSVLTSQDCGPDQVPTGGPSEEPAALAVRMRAAWAAFARTGRPVVDPGTEWPPYSVFPSSTESAIYRATMLLDTTCAIIEDPDEEERGLWDAVL